MSRLESDVAMYKLKWEEAERRFPTRLLALQKVHKRDMAAMQEKVRTRHHLACN